MPATTWKQGVVGRASARQSRRPSPWRAEARPTLALFVKRRVYGLNKAQYRTNGIKDELCFTYIQQLIVMSERLIISNFVEFLEDGNRITNKKQCHIRMAFLGFKCFSVLSH